MCSDVDAVSIAPARFCVGCNQVDSKIFMVRLVVIDNQLQVDYSRALPGRGAWLHLSSDCVDKARKRKAFLRAFKCSNLDVPAGIFEQILKILSGSQSADRCVADESGLEADGHPMSTQR